MVILFIFADLSSAHRRKNPSVSSTSIVSSIITQWNTFRIDTSSPTENAHTVLHSHQKDKKTESALRSKGSAASVRVNALPIFTEMDGNHSLNSTSSCNHYITKQDITFSVLYSMIVIVGVIGNSMVITVVRTTRSMHTTTNYFLMNLAVADLLTLLLCPGIYDFSLACAQIPSMVADVICKLFVGNAIVPITLNVAVLTVCIIAVERYLALIKPLHIRHFEDKIRYVIGAIWLTAFLSCIPDILTNTSSAISSPDYPCSRPWGLQEQAYNRPFIISTSVLFGFLPASLLTFCYFQIIRGLYFTHTICSEVAMAQEEERKSKKKLARLLIWLTALFIVCSLPFSGFFIYLLFLDSQEIEAQQETLYLAHRIVRFLLFSNSSLNPILYTFQSSNYRKGFSSLCFRKIATQADRMEMEIINKQATNGFV